MSADHLKPLTGLRFLAAMWVVLFHFWPHLAGVGVPMLVQKGYLGVELFFCLSGFILCHVYLPQYEAGRFHYSGFLWARIARVYPLHIATLVAVGAMALAAVSRGIQIDSHILSWASLPANLLMIHAWGFAPEAAWNHPSWSISAEFFAYLCFPVFAWLAMRMRRRPWAAAAGALAFLVFAYIAFQAWAGFPLTQATIRGGALRIVPCFLYGCASYLLWRSGAVRQRRVAIAGAAILGAVIVAGSALAAPDMVIVGLFGPLLLFMASLSSTGSHFGTDKVSIYLGEISYSIYMVCIPWSLVYFNVVTRLTDAPNKVLAWPFWIIGLLGVIPIAAASYHLVERPCRETMRSFRVAQADRGAKTTA